MSKNVAYYRSQKVELLDKNETRKLRNNNLDLHEVLTVFVAVAEAVTGAIEEQEIIEMFNRIRMNMFFFLTEMEKINNTDENTWIMDSGVGKHMTFRQDCFCEYNAHNDGTVITIGNCQELPVKGERNC